MSEHWIPVMGYPRYKVSNWGRVYDSINDRLLVLSVDRGGYLRVKLNTVDGDRKTVSLHRIVAGSFYDIDEEDFDDYEVNHYDFNKWNCSIGNLELTDRSGNMLHAFRGGHARPVHPIRPVRIRETGQIYNSTGEIDRLLGVSSGSVSKTLRGLQPTCKGYTFEYVD